MASATKKITGFEMKNVLARGGIEFIAVLLGITLSLYIDKKIEESSKLKIEKVFYLIYKLVLIKTSIIPNWF